MKRFVLLLTLAALLPLPLGAAINPAEFQNAATEQLRLRELARVVHETRRDGSTIRRVTLVAEVIAEQRSSKPRVGSTVVIDYSIDLVARERARRGHAALGAMPGPQFMPEPDPPQLDARGMFWANLAPAGSQLGKDNRHAGAVLPDGDYTFAGNVFVPVAGPYSFRQPPGDRRPED